MKYGKIKGETNSSYHGNLCVSASTIKTFIKSPLLYFKKHVEKSVKQDETPAMRFGSMVHEFILEPDVFAEKYVTLLPDFKATTKDDKAHLASIKEAGKVAIKATELAEVQRLSDAVYDNSIAKVLLSNGEAEVSWRVNAGLYDMQSRTDWFVESANAEQVAKLAESGISIKEGQPIIVDLKTTQELDAWFRDNYGNAIHQFSYQLQLAFYLAVINKIRKSEGKEIARHFLFVVVEKRAPYDCAVIALSERSFQLAQTQLRHYLGRLTACYEANNWQGYKDKGVLVAGVPERICEAEEMGIFESRDFSKIPFE